MKFKIAKCDLKARTASKIPFGVENAAARCPACRACPVKSSLLHWGEIPQGYLTGVGRNYLTGMEFSPRQIRRLFNWGLNYFTGAELLAIMIKTGAPGKSEVGIGRK